MPGIPFDKRRTARKRTETLTTRITIGSSGAVSSYTGTDITVVKTGSETGRYTLTVDKRYKSVVDPRAELILGDDAAATTAGGNMTFWRDDDIGRGANDGTIELQCARTDTTADANPTSGTVIIVNLELEVM